MEDGTTVQEPTNAEKSDMARIFSTEADAADFIRQLPPDDVVGVIILPDVMKPTTWIVRFREAKEDNCSIQTS